MLALSHNFFPKPARKFISGGEAGGAYYKSPTECSTNRRRSRGDPYSRIISPALRERRGAAGFRENSVNALAEGKNEGAGEEKGREASAIGAFKFDAWVCRMTSGGNEKKRE